MLIPGIKIRRDCGAKPRTNEKAIEGFQGWAYWIDYET